MKKNIAVVGCGHWGKNLVRNFAEMHVLHSVCDYDFELAKTILSRSDLSVSASPITQRTLRELPVQELAEARRWVARSDEILGRFLGQEWPLPELEV